MVAALCGPVTADKKLLVTIYGVIACSLDMILVGRNGAALAAFGEIVVLADFRPALEPSLGDRNEG